MKQTAVEWLLQELPKGYFDYQQIVIKQAKEMEKQQIIDAVNSQRQLGWDEKGTRYYNENYKQNETD